MENKEAIIITDAEWENGIAFYRPHGTIYDIVDNADKVINTGLHKHFYMEDGTIYRIPHRILNQL